MRLLRPIAIVVIIAGTAGCTSAKRPTPADVFDQRARQVVAQWPANPLARVWTSAYIPLQGGTVVPNADQSPASRQSVSPNDFILAKIYSEAADEGDYRFPSTLPAGPKQGTATYETGGESAVPVESSHDAINRLTPDGSSPDPTCSLKTGGNYCSLTITAVTYGTTMIWTNHGNTTVPAWLMTIAQWTAPVARVAVPTSAWTTAPPPADANVTMTGVAAAYDLLSVQGSRVAYRIDEQSCQQNLAPRVYETATAVVIGGTFTTYDGTCEGVDELRDFSVVLKAPLGSRPLLSVGNGYPILVGQAADKPLK